MDKDKIWEELKQVFNHNLLLIEEFKFPSKMDVELMQLSLIIGREHIDWVKYDYCYPPLDKDRLLDCLTNMAILGIEIPKDYEEAIMLKELKSQNLISKLKDKLDKKQHDLEFTKLWGVFKSTTAELWSVMSDDRSLHYETSYLKENIPNLVERYIYAFWMYDHWINNKNNKTDATKDLADKIVKIKDNNNFPEWKKRALHNLYRPDDYFIKDTYTQESEIKITQRVNNAKRYNYLFEL